MKFIKYSTLLTVTLLAGCAPEIVEWTPAESPKENKVERTVFYHTIQYPSQGKSFTGPSPIFLKELRLEVL